METTATATRKASKPRKSAPKITNEVDLKAKALQAYLDAKASGKSNPEARAMADSIAKVNPNKLNLHWYGDPRNKNGVAPEPAYGGLSEKAKDAMVVAWRADEGRSWGEIAILAGWEPESKVRTRWERGSKLSSTGHRTGQGGRFAFHEGELYCGNHKSLGAEVTPEELKQLRRDAEALAAYMKEADEYKSKMKAKAAAAKKAIKR